MTKYGTRQIISIKLPLQLRCVIYLFVSVALICLVLYLRKINDPTIQDVTNLPFHQLYLSVADPTLASEKQIYIYFSRIKKSVWYLPFIYSPSNSTVTYHFSDLQEVYSGNCQIHTKCHLQFLHPPQISTSDKCH